MSATPNLAFDLLQQEYYHAWFRFHPEEAASVGRQAYAGLLRTYDDDAIGALISLNQKMHSALDELVVTDTIPLSETARACKQIRQVSIANMLAETIRRIHDEESVSEMYID